MKFGVGSLFDSLEHPRTEEFSTWRPPEPPCLSNVKDIIIDFETNGLKWWENHRPVGVAYCLPDGTTGYLPWAHKSGYNLPKERVIDWMRTELRGKQITNASTRFEVHMALTEGIDLEAQGNRVSDVQHWAALLDDHRRKFSLEELCEAYLPEDERKVRSIGRETLDGSRMAEYPSGMIAIRAEADCRQVQKLMHVMRPQLIEQDLWRVKELEDDVIYASCEMERNALPIDVELLKRWVVASEEKLHRYLDEIFKESGVKFNPAASKSWNDLFNKLGIDWKYRTRMGHAAVSDDLIKRIDHPVIQKARAAGKLADLKSDFIDKYYHTIGPDGLLRFALHQLRSDEGGTISGRFSAAGIRVNNEMIGCNPQQVPHPKKQVEKGHDPEFIIRKLFIAAQGRSLISADAKQIEYRLFADYARNPKIMKAYEDDPDMSFHKLVHGMILPFAPNLIYEQCKNLNFMRIYGGGLGKLALMLGYITEQELNQLRRKYAPKGIPRTEPMLREALNVDEIYARELPEVKPLIDRAMHVAKTECDQWCDRSDELHRRFKHQGYVRTFLGRRMRFPEGQRLHKSLNGVIQGGAAEWMKRKCVEVHRERKRIGFIPRCTIHDALLGDSLDDKYTPYRLREILDVQSFPQIKVPIRWDVQIGPNWAQTSAIKDEYDGTKQDETRGGRNR